MDPTDAKFVRRIVRGHRNDDRAEDFVALSLAKIGSDCAQPVKAGRVIPIVEPKSR